MTVAMVCATGVESLMDYFEDLLPAEGRASLDAHVRDCARCTAFVKSYLATPRIVRAATRTEMPAAAQESLRAFLSRRND